MTPSAEPPLVSSARPADVTSHVRIVTSSVRYPSLIQINTRVWLTDLSRRIGRPASLDDIPDGELDVLERGGFDWVWWWSVWTTGDAAQRVSRSRPEWRREFEHTL